jgi:hypothetical protein
MAVEAGVDSIEHGNSIRPELAAGMAGKGIFLSPTIAVLAYVPTPGRGGPPDLGRDPDRTRIRRNCRKAA